MPKASHKTQPSAPEDVFSNTDPHQFWAGYDSFGGPATSKHPGRRYHELELPTPSTFVTIGGVYYYV
jgi:hypothetical protein